MKKFALVLLAAVSFTAAAGAQEFTNEPQEFILAKLAADEGRFDDALRLMDHVAEKNPGNPVVLYEHAMLLVQSGKVDRAESELRSVVQANPDFYDANRILGRIVLDRAGTDKPKLEEALKFLQAAFKANPDDLSSGIAVSQLLVTLERLPEAEKVLATMVERAPDQRAVNYAYAQVLTKLGRGDESKQYLERAVAVDPTFTPAIMQLLDIYQQESAWGKAADVMQALVDEDPTNLDLARQQAFFYLRAGQPEKARERFATIVAADPKDVKSQYFLGESLNDLENYPESEKIFSKLLAATPGDPDLLASYGLSLSGQKKWAEATKVFTQLLATSGAPENLSALAQTQLAYIDMQKGNYEAAVQTAKAVLVFNDKPNTQAISIALEALRKANRGAEVVALLEPLVTRFPDDPFVGAHYVEALARSGQTQKARERAAAQAKLGARNAMAVAEALLQAGDNTAAVATMRTAVDAKPDDIDLRFELGSVYDRAGDRASAEKEFLAVLDKDPNNAPALNYLGYMWAENGVNLDRAHDMLTRAVGQEPDNGAYVDSLGWVYFRLGNLDLAEKYLTDATRLLPRDATVHEHLGDVLARRGQNDRALALYRAALDLDPESKDVAKIRSKIAEIERQSQTSQR